MLSCIKNREPEAEHSESVPLKKKKKSWQDKKWWYPDFQKRPFNWLGLNCAKLVSGLCSECVSKYFLNLGHFV